MQKIINKIVEESLTDAIISNLKQSINGNINPEKLCDAFNLCPIYHNHKKILYNKLILSQYNPQDNLIHIYMGSIKEQFGDNFYSQITKALFHEIFHFLWSNNNIWTEQLVGNGRDRSLQVAGAISPTKVRTTNRTEHCSVPTNVDIELAANIFAEKLLIPLTLPSPLWGED